MRVGLALLKLSDGLARQARAGSEIGRTPVEALALFGDANSNCPLVFELCGFGGGRQGHEMPDHIRMMLSIPPKLSVSHVVGYIKGKSAIHIARTYEGKHGDYVGHHFWARGYFVSTVGRDEQMIREYIRNQEKEDKRLDQLLLTK